MGALFLAALLLPGWLHAKGIEIRHQEPLQQLELLEATQVPDPPLSGIRFNAMGRQFDITLAPNSSLMRRIALEKASGEVQVYRGSVRDVADSWVRLTRRNGQTSGLVAMRGEIYAIETDPVTGTPFIFNLDDLDVPAGMLHCAADRPPTSAAELLQSTKASVQTQHAPGAMTNLDMAIIGDAEFSGRNLVGGAAAALIARMNNVDGIFSEQLGVQLTVNRSDTFSASNDPFSAETESGALLDEVSDYRVSNSSQHSNGLTHLFTGRDLDGSTVGVAFTGALCSRRFGAGLTQATHSVTLDSLIAAHEIGHNFGAPHDSTSGSACESTPEDFLMAPQLNGSDEFSVCSIGEMQDDVNRASCITALPSTDVAASVDEQPSTPLQGNQARIAFAIDNVGARDASNVNLDVSIPSRVTLNSVSATSGSCSSGAGTASCALGSIAAGSGAVVRLDVTLDTTGEAQFVASATAADDDNAGNDEATVSLNIAPVANDPGDAGSNDSGGGSTGWLWIMVLLWSAVRRALPVRKEHVHFVV